MIKNVNFDYDVDNDSLFLFDPSSKSKASIELDNFIVDFNTKKEVVAIEILQASSFFKDLIDDFSLDFLKNISRSQLEIITKGNFLLLKFYLYVNDQKFVTPLFVPTISEPSPSLAVVK